MKRIRLFLLIIISVILSDLQGMFQEKRQFSAPPRQRPPTLPSFAEEKKREEQRKLTAVPISSPAPAKSNKLTIEVFVSQEDDVDDAIEEMQKFILHTNQGNFDIAILEQQTEETVPFWIGLLYLQQAVSAYQMLQEENKLTKKQQEQLEDLIQFNYASAIVDKMPADQKELHDKALLAAFEFILHSSQPQKEWINFLSKTKSVMLPTHIQKSIDGISILESFKNIMRKIFEKYQKHLRDARTAFQAELQTLLRAKLKPKMPIETERKSVAEKARGIVPVAVPIPIKKSVEPAVLELARPHPSPVIEQLAVQPEVTVAPMPTPIQPIVPSALAESDEPLPVPTLPISPVPEIGPGVLVTTSEQPLPYPQRGSREWVEQGVAYEHQRRRARTVQDVEKLLAELEDKKELYPELIERAQATLAEKKRAEGMQVIPYAGPLKPGAPEIKEPRYTLAPGVKEMLEAKEEAAWQQRMIEEHKMAEYQRELAEQQRMLEQIEQMQPIVETPIEAPTVTIPPPAPTPVVPLVEPVSVQPAAARVRPSRVKPVEPRPTAFAAAAELAPSPISPAVQAAMVVPPAVEVKPTIPLVPLAPAIKPVPSMLASPIQENVIAMFEGVVKKLEQMSLPPITEKSKDKDTVALAKVFLQQALEAFELYNKYQSEMKRQDVLIELRDYIVFFKQLKQAYIRAYNSTRPDIASSYLEAVEVAVAGEEKGRLLGWMKGSTITTKEQERQLKELKKRFAQDINELTVFVSILKTSTRDSIILKVTWEFITSLAIVVNVMRNNGVSEGEIQEAIKALKSLLPLVNSQSDRYNEAIEKELNEVRRALLNGFKRIGSDKYSYYLSIIHTSGAVASVYDDIIRALEKVDVKPPTRVEQEKYELTRFIKQQDPRALEKLQEIEQLPADEKQEMKAALQRMTLENQEKLATIFTQEIQQEAQAGNVAEAQALVQQAEKILPAQQATILAQVQPAITQAQTQLAEKARAVEPVVPVVELQPKEVEESVAPLVPPVRMPKPITPEEKEFLKQELSLTNQNIFKVLEIFARAIKLNDETSIRPAVFAMKNLMDKLNRAKAAELQQLEVQLVDQLRNVWQQQAQDMAIAYLVSGEQFIALTTRAKRLQELETLMNQGPTTQQLHNMVPELQMMIDLGQRNKEAQAISRKAQILYDRVMQRLAAFTRWM